MLNIAIYFTLATAVGEKKDFLWKNEFNSIETKAGPFFSAGVSQWKILEDISGDTGQEEGICGYRIPFIEVRLLFLQKLEMAVLSSLMISCSQLFEVNILHL